MTGNDASNTGREENTSDEAQIVSVKPVDSPSENYLVTEHLREMPRLFARGLVYLVAALVVVAVLYAALAKIDIVAECRAVVKPKGEIIQVLADRAGVIDQVFIEAGQEVRRNDPLYRIRSRETMNYQAKVEELSQTIPLTEQQYDTRIASAQERLKQRISEHEGAQTVFDLQIKQNDLSLKSAESDLSYWQTESETLTEEFNRIRDAVSRGYMSVTTFNEKKSAMERALNETEKAAAACETVLNEHAIIIQNRTNENTDFANERIIIEQEIANLRIEKETTLHSMRNELERNRQLLTLSGEQVSGQQSDQETGDIIRAERDGIISELYSRTSGGYVGVSDPLCSIVPLESPLYLDITVQNKDIGFIEKGFEIKYKFDAFPFTDYGIKRGVVETIAPSAVQEPTGQFVYRIEGTLDDPFFEMDDATYQVKPGMTATAEIVKERVTLFSVLFRRIRM